MTMATSLMNFVGYESDGFRHDVTIYRRGECYVVRVDGEFYATEDNFGEAVDEVNDIFYTMGWLMTNPCYA